MHKISNLLPPLSLSFTGLSNAHLSAYTLYIDLNYERETERGEKKEERGERKR
jgi:hypothetical protein